uniref:DNA mismatch repair protein MutS core domain-containing protein n=1 Tax=Parascaris univalens TaxID=6257 RepID=A0A915A4U1_PARUN
MDRKMRRAVGTSSISIPAETSRRETTSSSLPKYKFHLGACSSSRTPASSRRSAKSCVIVSVVEGRGNARGEVGLASMDALCSELSLSQFIDTASYTRLRIQLQVLDPVEVIVPDTAMDKSKSMTAVVEIIENTFPSAELTFVARQHFSDMRGVQLVQQLSTDESSNITAEVLQKYYCMAAAAALIKYVEHIQNVLFAQSSLKITYEGLSKVCFIDVNTMHSLEIVGPPGHTRASSNRSLYSVLENCLTGGGVRMLRSNLLQPSADVSVINARCDAVDELLSNQPKLERLRAIISGAYEIQHLVTLCCYLEKEADSIRSTEQKLSQVLNLKDTLNLIGPLRKALDSSKSTILKACYESLNDARFEEVRKALNERLSSKATMVEKSSFGVRNRRCYAVRDGQNNMIDLARRAYEEMLADVEEKAKEETANLADAKLVYTAQRGFHYSIGIADPLIELRLPSMFIQVVRHRASISCTTRELIKYNDRIAVAVDEIMVNSNAVVVGLLSQIRASIGYLYSVVEVISTIDFFASLAMYAMKTPTVRPSFSEANALVIRRGRHPLLDIAIDDVIANDCYLSKESRIAIITGPNMAGKTTYLKQVCLLQVLAQIGCFVPAEFAAFPIITRIFSRMGHNDNLTSNLSSFAVEMSEMVPVLANANSSSLIVIDELARSTSSEEGIGICYAVCEELIKAEAFTLFATHFLGLSSLAANYVIVENYHFSATTSVVRDENGAETERLSNTHRLFKGPYKGPLYGFHLVELASFPHEVVKEARKIATQLHSESEATSVIDDDSRHNRNLLRLAHKLRSMLPILEASEEDACAKYFANLRETFLESVSSEQGYKCQL